MPLFAMVGRDGPDGLERRPAVRPRHLEHLKELDRNGKIRFAGPAFRDDGKTLQGSVVIFEADDLESARASRAEAHASEGSNLKRAPLAGAVGVGCQRMGITVRPKGVARLQALAAVGQPHLMRHYDHLFATLGQPIAQVLLSAEALDSRQGYNNAAATFNELFALGVIPIVNENDSVNVSELRCVRRTATRDDDGDARRATRFGARDAARASSSSRARRGGGRARAARRGDARVWRRRRDDQ